ncbi:tegument protein VP22 [Pteropodid alphaherpesvirus 1]|uniref:Tegument protein VP22 n=1 Tax=Pteropodid alphaherpesvirus 1 TaxID=1343901 RepID=A0A060PYB5_9ALPH|nr:tegument protein VP22 [Pteropodid alphaherpesvirus 1]BAP00728.1 tegument protein VP22 [Pteropodid alphaherpesvirus 1]
MATRRTARPPARTPAPSRPVLERYASSSSTSTRGGSIYDTDDRPGGEVQRRHYHQCEEDWPVYSDSFESSSDDELDAAMSAPTPSEPTGRGRGAGRSAAPRAPAARRAPASGGQTNTRGTRGTAANPPTSRPPALEPDADVTARAGQGRRARKPATKPAPPPTIDSQAKGLTASNLLQFSGAPSSPTSPWNGRTAIFNKRTFCAAVGRVAAKHARQAAAKLWDMSNPQNDEELNTLLGATNIRITVCEGQDLLPRANDLVTGACPEPESTSRTPARSVARSTSRARRPN